MGSLSSCLLIACFAVFGRAFLTPERRQHGKLADVSSRRSGPLVCVGSDTFMSSQSYLASSSTRLFGDLQTARRHVGEGMQAFRQGRIEESIASFDQAEQAEPKLDPFLWQRGLSYYYANEFDKASAQFRRDVKVNPLDVEEIVWDIASQLRAAHLEDSSSSSATTTLFPLPNALSLPKGQLDRRPIMAVVYQLFQGQASEQALAKAGHLTGRASDEFYALLYLGLYAEARQDATKAENYMRQAVHTEYAQTVGRRDYMTDVARIHCRLRGWTN